MQLPFCDLDWANVQMPVCHFAMIYCGIGVPGKASLSLGKALYKIQYLVLLLLQNLKPSFFLVFSSLTSHHLVAVYTGTPILIGEKTTENTAIQMLKSPMALLKKGNSVYIVKKIPPLETTVSSRLLSATSLPGTQVSVRTTKP